MSLDLTLKGWTARSGGFKAAAAAAAAALKLLWLWVHVFVSTPASRDATASTNGSLMTLFALAGTWSSKQFCRVGVVRAPKGRTAKSRNFASISNSTPGAV